jgi:hypothetical protein
MPQPSLEQVVRSEILVTKNATRLCACTLVGRGGLLKHAPRLARRH